MVSIVLPTAISSSAVEEHGHRHPQDVVPG
jgi:hypothetical protein